MDRDLLKTSINHILESGPNDIRIIELFDRFLVDKDELIQAQRAVNNLQALRISELETEVNKVLSVSNKTLIQRSINLLTILKKDNLLTYFLDTNKPLVDELKRLINE